jgi:acyl-CoA synthetase (NDP forming)
MIVSSRMDKGLLEPSYESGGTTGDWLKELWEEGHDIREKLVKINLSASQELGEHIVGPKVAGGKMKIPNEVHALFAAGEGNKTVVGGEEISVSVQKDGVSLLEGYSLA